MTEKSVFAKLSDDVVLNIFFKLEEDPRNWARLACVCTKFSSLIRHVCYKTKCTSTIPSVVSDLACGGSSFPPGGWSSLYKLAVSCPGLLHAGVLLEHSDFGLERDLGPDESFRPISETETTTSSSNPEPEPENCEGSWSLYDDLYNDTLYNASDGVTDTPTNPNSVPWEVDGVNPPGKGEFTVAKRRRICRCMRSHLASGVWKLRREQGNKLLASRFREDCLYICDWPGCVHIEEKRNYMLFRGVFRNFKKSRVWRTINDGNRNRIDLNCAFCACKQTWDLHSAFCLRRVYGYHDDGEPVVRAYVCENGHVSGAWTDLPLYT